MSNKKAAVFIILGQSNAVGHGIPMCEEDRILTPLKNVFGLSREDNQSFDNTTLTWRGYTSFGMNLAEEQDNTYSLPNCLAASWQAHIDAGNQNGLPDLYIVQIAIGAQGVTREYMWYPERERVLVPGKLGTVNISLFPFSTHILGLLDDSFAAMQMDYEIIGLHWRGGENDITDSNAYLKENLMDIYRRIFGEFNRILKHPPIVLHEIYCPERMHDLDPTGAYLKNMFFINDTFHALANEFDNISLFDVRRAPFYIADERQHGIFIGDAIHYTAQTNKWVAGEFFSEYLARYGT